MASRDYISTPMASVFSSPKQPTLFPVTLPAVKISREEYHAFYKYECFLFNILMFLHRGAVKSVLVIGFLIWLEREGYCSSALPNRIVKTLTPVVINQFVNEVVICFKFFLKKADNLMFEGSSNNYKISILQSFLDRKQIDLVELYNNGDLISKQVRCIANDISIKVFDDILGKYVKCVGARTVHTRSVIRQNPLPPLNDFNQSISFGKNNAYVGSVERDSCEDIPPDCRTIFLTFSKGYPLSENEILIFFTRMFGDSIQSVHMQSVKPDAQPLYARIMVRSPSLVRIVTEKDGPHGKSKYTINGKHVWARKFIPRTPNKYPSIHVPKRIA